jgi:prepilin-type N-terminal cleavage/methylation domain-containing protein
MKHANFHIVKLRIKHGQRGFSLVELMVAMAMSLALLTVVLQGFASMSNASRASTVQQQMNEDAQAAFQILGPQIRMAGFSPLHARSSLTILPDKNTLGGTNYTVINETSSNGTPIAVLVIDSDDPFGTTGETGLGIFGCQSGFTNLTAAGHISQLTCNPAGLDPSLAVQYEADEYSLHISGAGNTPSDCRSFAVPYRKQALKDSALPSAAIIPATYYLVENRYFISKDANNNPTGLSCTGNGGATPFGTPTQPLVANIESMQIDYGVRAPQPLPTVPKATLDAIEVLRAADPSRSTWPQAQRDADDQNQANVTASRVSAGYLTANQIGAASGDDATGVHGGFAISQDDPGNPDSIDERMKRGSQRWNLVNTVRVCLVVRSAAVTLTDELGRDANNNVIQGYYFGCNPTTNIPIPITDGVLRKAYTMHFAIRSRVKTPS